jgi:hypothetical protein
MDHNYKTDLYLTLDGVTLEYEAKVFFTHRAGYAGDMTDPPEDATVELTDVHVTIPGRDPFKLGPPALLDALNAAMQVEMFEFAAACRDEAAEARAEARRDD